MQAADTVVDMESEFLSLGLDIIGLGVFNYDFGCINKESPVIKVGTRAGRGGAGAPRWCCVRGGLGLSGPCL